MSTTSPIVSVFFNPATLQGAIVYAIIAVAVAWILGTILRLAVHRYLDRAQAAGADSTSVRFLGELTRVAVYVFAFLLYARLVPALQSLGTAWLASVGVVSVVVGLAAQSTLSNLIAGVSLVIYRPFHIGDRIQVAAPAGPEIGIVESVDLGYTTMRTSDGRRLVLPNSVIANQTTINLSRSLPHIACDVSFTIAEAVGSANSGVVDKARAVLLDVAKKTPNIATINGCFVTGINGQGTVLTLSAMCVEPADVSRIKSDLFENAKKRFDTEGIKIVS